MEMIKLPMDLGLEVIKELRKKGYEPRQNNMGLLSLEFTQEELNKITELEFINPRADSLAGLEHLLNLRTLRIRTTGNTAYRKENASISDKDITRISNATSLRHLTIENQSAITWINLDKLLELEELCIIRNTLVDEIDGLDRLKKLKDISIYGNKNLYQVKGITTLIKENELDSLELDLLSYPEVEPLRNQLMHMINCDFVEAISGEKRVTYTCAQADLFHQKCLVIMEKIKRQSPNRRTIIVGIEKYLAENVTYDDDGRENPNRVHTENGRRRGKNGGTNSAYNGIMFGSCVCEGYTRAIQYLLKIIGIKTANVHCISGANKIRINRNYHNVISLPDDGYHSIIRIDDENMLYCDPCWDALQWQHGFQTLPYCLLTKEEISKDHTLSFEEDIVSNNHLQIARKQIQAILKSLSQENTDTIEEGKKHRR